MDLKNLLQKMQQLDEGCDPSLEECGGDMPVVVQGEQPHDDSLTMNLTINSKGADSIRDLLDVLKGIDGQSEPKDMPHDHNALFGNDHDKHDHDDEIVIGDDYGNAKQGDRGSKVFDQDTMFPVGDDLASKGREALKKNGGGNPLAESLHALYEEIKDRQKKR